MTDKKLSSGSVAFIAIFGASLPAVGLSQGTFLRTVQPLDDEIRGYCLDVAGRGQNIDLSSALRMHTCKIGESNEDQFFQWLETGQSVVREYELCLGTDRIGIEDSSFL